MLSLGLPDRAAAELGISMAIALVLALLNLSINFIDEIHAFFTAYTRFPATEFFVNFLFFWLVALLAVAFAHWREAVRKRAELQAVISSISPDVLLVVKPDRTITLCNLSISRLLGYEAGEVIGQKTDLLYSDRRANPARRHEIYETLQREGFHVGTATGCRKDGTTVPLEIITGSLQGREGAVLLLRDITDRVRAEERRRELETQMQRLQKQESLGVLVGGIAHHFNNLLMGILGNTSLALSRSEPDSPLHDNLLSIERAGQRAAEITSQMLSYSGQAEFSVEKLYLSRLIEEMRPQLAAECSAGVRLAFRLEDGLPPVNADAGQMREIVKSLVSNAFEAMGADGGAITVATGSFHADQNYLASCYINERLAEGTYVFLEVSDTGCGMSQETLQRIFDPFFSTKFIGRGMRLSTVLGIVRSHRGTCRVTSTLGEGTTLRVLFPAAA